MEYVEIILAGEDQKFASTRTRDQILSKGHTVAYVDVAANPGNKHLVDWFGGENNEVEYMTALIGGSPLAMGLINTKCAILLGQGLCLYREEIQNGKRVKEPVLFREHPEIEDFFEFNELDHWAHTSLLTHEWVGNYFAEMIPNKSKKKIVELHHKLPQFIRAVDPEDGTNDVRQYYFVDQWTTTGGLKKGRLIKAWRKRDFYNASRQINRNNTPNKVLFHGKFDLPSHPFYAIPAWYGARKWLEVNNQIPFWHLGNLANASGMRLQCLVSRHYLDTRMKIPKKDGTFPSELEVKKALAKEMHDFFSNPENAGKTLINGYNKDHQGKPIEDLILKPLHIDQKDKAYVDLTPVASGAVTSSMAMDPSLAGMILDGKLSSGSEKRMAWNIEVMKAFAIRNLILRPLRFIHKYNEWDPTLKWGFKDRVLDSTDNEPSGIRQPETTEENTPNEQD